MRLPWARGLRTTALLLILGGLLTTAAGPFGAAVRPRGTTVPLDVSLEGGGFVLLGSEVGLWANATGGHPPYRFSWILNDTNVTSNVTNTSGVGQRFTFLPLGNAIYSVTVAVRDSDTNATSKRVTVEVTGPGPVSVTLTVGAAPNAAARLTAHAQGGSPPYEYRWSGPGAPAGFGPSPELNLTGLPNGLSNFTVVARDTQGFDGSARVTVHYASSTSGTTLPSYGWFVAGLAASLVAVLTVLYVIHRRRSRPPAAGSVPPNGGPPPGAP